VLTAACLGNADEFHNRLEVLTQHYAGRDAGRMRAWCEALLGRAVGTAGAWTWLTKELKDMGLDGAAAIRKAVLPGVSVAGAHDLHEEIEALLDLRADLPDL